MNEYINIFYKYLLSKLYIFDDQLLEYKNNALYFVNNLFTVKISNKTGYWSSYSAKYNVNVIDNLTNKSCKNIYNNRDIDTQYQKICDFIFEIFNECHE